MKVKLCIQMKSWAALVVFCFSLVSMSTSCEEVDEFDFGNISFEAAAGDSTPAEGRNDAESFDKRAFVHVPAVFVPDVCLQPANRVNKKVALTFVTYCVGKSLYLAHRAVIL